MTVGGVSTDYAYDGTMLVREFQINQQTGLLAPSATYMVGPMGPCCRINEQNQTEGYYPAGVTSTTPLTRGVTRWYVYDGLGMNDPVISVIDIARHSNKHKQTVFKVIKRLGIEMTMQRRSDSRNQMVAYVTEDDSERIAEELAGMRITLSQDSTDEALDFVSAEVGVFYLIQLEPNLDPVRFKVGFASNMTDRLRALRCSAPMAKIVATWRCRRLWEKTAIEAVTFGLERLHTEVFRAVAIEAVRQKCDAFFDVMPPLE